MLTPEDAKKKAAATYNAASDCYDHPANIFWELWRTVKRLGLALGARVLDVCQLSSPEDWWPMVLGRGYRGTLEQLDAEDRERVRLKNLDFIRRANVRSVEANVVYAATRR